MADWRRRLEAGFGSLKFQVTVGVILALTLGIGIITMLLMRQAEHDTLSSQHQRELNESVRTASMLSRRVVDLQRALKATAGQIDAATLADVDRLGQFLESRPILLNLFTNVFVVSPDGEMRLFVDGKGQRKPGVDLSDRDYFRRTLASGRGVVSGPVPGRVSREPVIVVTFPIKREDRLQGVLCGVLRLASRDLLGDIVDGNETDLGALTVVTDSHGVVLAHPDRDRLQKPLSEDPRFAHAFANWQAMGQPVEPSGLALSQPGQVMSAAGVAGPDWVIWRTLDEDKLLQPLRAARRQAMVWAVELIAVISLVTLYGLGWLLRPLRRLESRAEHLFDGRQDPHEGWPEGDGEIGRLGRVLKHVVSERAQLEDLNARVLKKLGSVMSAAPVGIAFTRALRFELVSAEFCRLLGRTEKALLGQPTHVIFAEAEDDVTVTPLVLDAFRAGEAYVGEWEMQRPDGQRFWAQLRGRPVDLADLDAGTIWTVSDVTAQVTARKQLQWIASHDPLTGLANRPAFEERLNHLFQTLPQSLPAELIVIDLDAFKPVNDVAGHAAGDAMLKAVAQAISACVRASDLVVRTGGDEFAVLLERCQHGVALGLAEKVRTAITGITLMAGGHSLRVGASLGVASLRSDSASAAAWLQEADTACYQAKAAGRGAVRAAGPSSPSAERTRRFEVTLEG